MQEIGGLIVLLNWPCDWHKKAIQWASQEQPQSGAALNHNWPKHEWIHDLGGQLDLTQLMALQAQSKLVVASSTGPLHTASAMGIPVLGLYGTHAPEWPERWAPLGPKTHILQALHTTPEGQLDLTVEAVFTAAKKALS